MFVAKKTTGHRIHRYDKKMKCDLRRIESTKQHRISENPYSWAMRQWLQTFSRFKAPIRTLGVEHRFAILHHLMALSERDRYLRFGYAASDAHIQRYVQNLRFERDEIFGVFNWRLQLIAMAHLAYMLDETKQHSAEFGVSVARAARGRGYGAQLFDRAVRHARNQGVTNIIVHALTENAAMLSIASKAGATLVRDGAESQASLQVPAADFRSHLTELVEEQLARTQYQFKAKGRWVRSVVRGAQALWHRVFRRRTLA